MSSTVWVLTRSTPSNSTLPRTRCNGASQGSAGVSSSALAAFSFPNSDTLIPYGLVETRPLRWKLSVSTNSNEGLNISRVPAGASVIEVRVDEQKSPEYLLQNASFPLFLLTLTSLTTLLKPRSASHSQSGHYDRHSALYPSLQVTVHLLGKLACTGNGIGG